jgi:hypothetical protein
MGDFVHCFAANPFPIIRRETFDFWPLLCRLSSASQQLYSLCLAVSLGMHDDEVNSLCSSCRALQDYCFVRLSFCAAQAHLIQSLDQSSEAPALSRKAQFQYTRLLLEEKEFDGTTKDVSLHHEKGRPICTELGRSSTSPLILFRASRQQERSASQTTRRELRLTKEKSFATAAQ